MRNPLIGVLGCALALSGCAILRNPVRVAPEGCRYANVFVETEAVLVDEESRPMHSAILAAAVHELPGTGFRKVEDPLEASFHFGVGVVMTPGNRALASINLKPELEFMNHIFLAQLDDNAFPYRGDAGGSRGIELAVPLNLERERGRIRNAVRSMWDIEAEQILALCEMEATLRSEGWADIEELRKQLVHEMKQIRRQRAEQRP